MTAFDDYGPIAAVPIPAAMPTAVMVPEFGACTAESIAITELSAIAEMIGANTYADAEILSVS
jgi:hypothetical protein